MMQTVPIHLKNFPRQANETIRDAHIRWFREAKYGLFLHYGLYSLLESHEWDQFIKKIPVAEYAKLAEDFTAEHFDADAICRFALSCGMRYITLTTRHHDCFCLFKTAQTEFQSLNSPAKRDLVKELADACEAHGLAFFAYYSHGRDWKHPHAPNNDEWGGMARPEYPSPEPSYCYGDAHDLNHYVDFMNNQVVELLTQYPTIAGIWFDGISVPQQGPTEQFRIPETYELIRKTSPHALISYKQGMTGDEDFFAPEHHIPDASASAAAQGLIGQHPEKIIEICSTMGEAWGYRKNGTHKTAEDVWQALEKAVSMGGNLLMNTGPMPDGRLDPLDMNPLLEVGERIRKCGFPAGKA